MKRDTIFLGHANPEDDEFTLWLQAKLENEGFRVVTDHSYLTGGESDYWKELDNVLTNHACKYLLVFSNITFSKSGVLDEWEQARAVGTRKNLKDFVMLLKIDDVPFDDRIGTNRMNQFRFDLSWADGLKKLVYKLDKDEVPRFGDKKSSMDEWLKNKYTTFSGVKVKTETFYSNWLEINSIPKKIFFHRYSNSKQVAAVLKEMKYPGVKLDNHLVSFVETPPTYLETEGISVEPNGRLEIASANVFNYYDSENFPKYQDLRKNFVQLLRTAFEFHLNELGLSRYELSTRNCYYYKTDVLEKDRAQFIFNEKRKRKNLVGAFHDDFWHFGISVQPLLRPHLCLSIKSHLVFTTDGSEIWTSKSKMHAARRRKGKSYFNKDWRNFLLAFTASLCDDGKQILIPVNPDESINLPVTPIEFECERGYEEPKDKGRLVPIDYSEDLEDWLQEVESIENEGKE